MIWLVIASAAYYPEHGTTDWLHMGFDEAEALDWYNSDGSGADDLSLVRIDTDGEQPTWTVVDSR